MARGCGGSTSVFETERKSSTLLRAIMTLVLSYEINFQNSDGDILDADADVNFPNILEGPQLPENACDETARRYLISKILAEGGRVIKLNKAGHRWKKYEAGD